MAMSAPSMDSASEPAPAAALSAAAERASSLARSLCQLLQERTPLDKALLLPSAPALQLIARETASWIDWSAWDARLHELAAEREASLAAERVVAQEEHEASVAEAIADGKEAPIKKPPSEIDDDALAAALDVPSSLAAPLVDSPELGQSFATFLLREVLIRPHPLTHVNTALLLDAPSRRLAFALLQVACQQHPASLRVVLDWVGEKHARTRAEQLRLQSDSEPCGTEDLWDIDPSTSQRSSTGFVGLKNQGATCYQNSFLQLLFHSPAFSSPLLRVRERDPHFESDDAEEGEEEQTLLARVQSIFYYLAHSRRRSFDPLAFVRSFKGYDGQPLNPLVQQDVLEFCNMLFDRLEGNLDKVAREQGIEAAQASETTAAESTSAAVSAASPSSSSSSAASASTNLLKRCFGGLLQNQLICSEYPALDHKFARAEPFLVLSLDIKGCSSLESALENYVQGELLEGSNAYMCPSCQAKRDTKKRCVVSHWPRLTIFHLKRFEFEFHKMRTVKLNDEVTFPLEIDLEPYTAQGVERREAEEAAKVAAAEAAGAADEEKKADAPEPAAAAVAAAGGNDADLSQFAHTLTDLPVNIFYPCSQCARKATVECAECARKYCQLHEQEAHAECSPPAGDAAATGGAGNVDGTSSAAASPAAPAHEKQLYRLVGVLVHSGHAEGGHYYSYIRARSASGSVKSGRWHEFNDQVISDFDPRKLPEECFGGMEDPAAAAAAAAGKDGFTGADPPMETVVSHKAKRRGKNKGKGASDEEWQTGKVEKSRNAYLLWYERVDADELQPAESSSCNGCSAAKVSPIDALSSSVGSLSLSAASTAAAASTSAAVAAASPFHSVDPSTLPRLLRKMHVRIQRENAQQLHDELHFEKAYHDALYKIARDSIEWVPNRPPAQLLNGVDDELAAASAASASAAAASPAKPAAKHPGLRYLDDISKLDKSDLSVQYLQHLTLFVLETYARASENGRLDQWCMLLQHGYDAHVGCCQWLLERFVLDPPLLDQILLHCPHASTRKSIANLLELAVKKLIRFEVDDEFVDAYHIMLPPLKPIQKRADAQAGLAAALGADAAATSSVPISSLSSLPGPAAIGKSSSLAASSSSASFLPSALVQSACVDVQLAPKGVFKESAKATVAVHAKLAVLEGVGKGTEKQFNTVGIKTLQQLVEITPKQRELIAHLPAPAMTVAHLDTFVARAKQGVDFILEVSGVNAKLAEEAARAAERAKAKKAAAGSEFVGPRLLPAFIRTALQTLSHVAETSGEGLHCAPELCELLSNLAQCNPGMMRLLIEQQAIETCIKLIIAPITFVEEVRARKAAEKAAEGSDDAAVVDDDNADTAAESEDAAEAKDDSAPSTAAPAAAADEDDGRTEEERREEREMLEAIAAVEAAEAKAAGKSSDASSSGAKKKKKQGKGPAAAAFAASASDGKADEKNESEKKSDDSKAAASASDSDDDSDDDDDDDEQTDLSDLGVVEVVGLLTILVKATTTRSGKAGEAAAPLPANPGPTIAPETWDTLRRAPFLTRLVLQISATKPDPPSVLAAHLAWESLEVTDRLIDEIMVSIRKYDFFDNYAGIKLLQHLLMTVHDDLSEYRVELAMPRLLMEASEQRCYYKQAELLIKGVLHLIQHVPAVASWAKLHMEEMKWMDAWLGRNKKMPARRKKGEPRIPKDGINATKAVKFGKDSGTSEKWEKSWNEQIHEYGVGQCANDSVTDYQKLFRKIMLSLKVRKA